MSKELERRHVELSNMEIRNTDDGKTIVGGYVVEFEKLSVPLYGFREKVRKGAFEKSLRNSNVKALWNHNSDLVLGSTKNGTLKLWEDDRGLKFELELPDTTWGRDAAATIKRGDVDGVSFGFETVVDEWDNSDENNVIRTLVEVNLFEISPTPFPAYPDSSVGVRSAKQVYEEYASSLQADGGAEDKPQARSLSLKRKKLEIIAKEVI